MIYKKRIEKFNDLGFGMFVHFGIYSLVGKGEWYLHNSKNEDNATLAREKYERLPEKFNPSKNWAKRLVRTAKSAGCRYITLTTRHHDGFSLYDTRGLSDYDAVHAKCGRDLIKEFVDACNEGGVVPFFYHTLLDWHHPDYNENFPKYIDYLVKSIETLCSHYGTIGGLWFDGMWDKKDADWQEDRIYGTIRKYQPEAMIINNTGLDALGEVGHPEIDSVTFERGKPCLSHVGDRHIAGEMCQVLNDHWGYAKNDANYKSIGSLIEDLVDCRANGCNFLLNVGPLGNGLVKPLDKGIFGEIGKFVKSVGDLIYKLRFCDLVGHNALIATDKEGNYYALIKDVGMGADPNVAQMRKGREISVENREIIQANWLDNGKKIEVKDGKFVSEPYPAECNYGVRVAKIVLR